MKSMSRITTAKLVIGLALALALLYTIVRLDAWYATGQLEQADQAAVEVQP